MPGGDGTGPGGMGPMTGRGAGYCAGYPVPGFMNPTPGFGYGRGFGGGGRGRRNWFYATGMPGWARAGAGLPAWGAGGGVPPVGYGVPPVGYGVPAAGYGVPPAGYGVPPVGYGVPPVGYGAPPSAQQQLDLLKGQAEYLEDALDGVRKRMAEMEKQQEA